MIKNSQKRLKNDQNSQKRLRNDENALISLFYKLL